MRQTFYQLEQDVYIASFHRAPCPFTLSFGVLSLTELTKNMHTMFNRVGGCVSYKYATSLREMHATEYGEDKFRRHYSKIPDNNIMFAAMDNLNMDNCHGIVIAGAPAKRFHGVATQAVGFQDEPKQSLSVPPLPDIASIEEAAPTRDAYVSQLVPGPLDEYFVCLQVVLFGLLSEHGERLDGRDG